MRAQGSSVPTTMRTQSSIVKTMVHANSVYSMSGWSRHSGSDLKKYARIDSTTQSRSTPSSTMPPPEPCGFSRVRYTRCRQLIVVVWGTILNMLGCKLCMSCRRRSSLCDLSSASASWRLRIQVCCLRGMSQEIDALELILLTGDFCSEGITAGLPPMEERHVHRTQCGVQA